jgi:hypothetical protein
MDHDYKREIKGEHYAPANYEEVGKDTLDTETIIQ